MTVESERLMYYGVCGPSRWVQQPARCPNLSCVGIRYEVTKKQSHRIQHRFSRASRIREETLTLLGASPSVLKGLPIGAWIAVMKMKKWEQ